MIVACCCFVFSLHSFISTAKSKVMRSAAVFLLLFYLVSVADVISFDHNTCKSAKIFKEVVEGASKVRWVKVTKWSDFSYDRTHSDSAKATVVECDSNDCTTCSPVGSEFDIFPHRDYQCQHLQVGETYLIAIGDQDELLTTPLIVEPKDWSNFRQLCHFTQQKQSRIEALKGCKPVSEQCFSNDTPVKLLLTTANSNSKCSDSLSFAERLAVAGEASVVDFTGLIWNPNGFQDMAYAPCDDVRCKDLQIASQLNNPPCPVTYGKLSATTDSFRLRYPAEADCGGYKWIQPSANLSHFLVFHEAPSSSPFIWLRAVPLELTPELWKELSKTCYFASKNSPDCSAGCVNDVSLAAASDAVSAAETTPAPTTPTYSCGSLSCDDFSFADSQKVNYFLGRYQGKVKTVEGYNVTITKCLSDSSCPESSTCVEDEPKVYTCKSYSTKTNCDYIPDNWVGKIFAVFTVNDSKIYWSGMRGPCHDVASWQNQLDYCEVPCEKAEFCCSNAASTAMPATASKPFLDTCETLSCWKLAEAEKDFHVSKIFLGNVVSVREVSPNPGRRVAVTVSECLSANSCSDCIGDGSQTDIICNPGQMGEDPTCYYMDFKNGQNYLFFENVNLMQYAPVGPCSVDQWNALLQRCSANVSCSSDKITYCCPALTPSIPSTLQPTTTSLSTPLLTLPPDEPSTTETPIPSTLQPTTTTTSLSTPLLTLPPDEPSTTETPIPSSSQPTTTSLTSPVDESSANYDCNKNCDSDCLEDRFDISFMVLLGHRQDLTSQEVIIDCWLKKPSFEDYDNVVLREHTQCNGTGIGLPETTSVHIFFANKSDPPKPPNYVTFTAPAVPIDNNNAWQLAGRYCGVSVAFALDGGDGSASMFCCTSTPAPCLPHVSISNVSNIDTSNKEGTTPVPLIDYCEEMKCPYEMCDSDCMMSRMDGSTNVFWGESLSEVSDSPVAVYCWLKQSTVGSLNGTVFISSPAPTRRCDMSVPKKSSGPHLFFVRLENSHSNYTMVAKPVPVSSYAAWQQVTALCGVTPESPNTKWTLPFGTCEKNTKRPLCDRDVSLVKIKELNNVTCPGASDSLAVRFSGVTSSSRQLLLRTVSTPVSVDLSLTNFCAINSGEDYLNNLTLKLNETCFPMIYEKSWGQIIIAVDQTEIPYQVTAGCQLLRPNSADTWPAITQMCSLWRLNSTGSMLQTGCKLPDPGHHPKTGCFYDLSATEIQEKDFSLSKKREICENMTTDSYAERFRRASVVVYGFVRSVDYASRKLTFKRSCLLKRGVADFPIYQDVTINIGKDEDGCFAIDEYAVQLNKSFILFLNDSHNMVMREVAIDELFQLELFASVCGALVNQCQMRFDPKQGCFADLNVTDIMAYAEPPQPSSLPPLTQPTCCYDHFQENLDDTLFKASDQIAWATIDTLMTVTPPDPTNGGNRLVAVSIILHCIMMDDYNPDPARVVMVNLKSLTAALHVGADYIFIMRIIRNNPWKNIQYEIIAPPVPATKAVWYAMCDVCAARPPTRQYPSFDSARCGPGGIKQCFDVSVVNLEYCRMDYDLLSDEFACTALSNNFTQRLYTTTDGSTAIWGEVISSTVKVMQEDDPGVRVALMSAYPLDKPHSRVTHNFVFQPICQISGDTKPSTSTIFLTYYESDCFYNKTFDLLPNKRYLVFLNSHIGLLTAQPIPIDEEGIKKVAKSCEIRPPPFSIFSPNDVDLYQGVCPTVTLPSKICNYTIHVNELWRSDVPEVPADGMQWWEVTLIVLASIVGFAIVAVSCRFFALSSRRSQVPTSFTSPRPVNSERSGRSGGARHTLLLTSEDLMEDDDDLPGLGREFFNSSAERINDSAANGSERRLAAIGDVLGGSGELGMMSVRRVRTASDDRRNDSFGGGESDSRTRLIAECETSPDSPETRPKSGRVKKSPKKSSSRPENTTSKGSERPTTSSSANIDINNRPSQTDLLVQLANSPDDIDFGVSDLTRYQQQNL